MCENKKRIVLVVGDMPMRYAKLRKRLDESGYFKEVLSDEAIAITERLLNDLEKERETHKKTLQGFQHYKSLAEQLEAGVVPFNEENIQLIKNNSVLRMEVLRTKENSEEISRESKSKIRELESDNTDLKLLINQFVGRVKKLESENSAKEIKILTLEGKNIEAITSANKKDKDTILEMEINCRPVPMCHHCTRIRNAVEFGKGRDPQAMDYIKIADSRIEALQLQIRKMKTTQKDLMDMVASMKTKVEERDSEIETLRGLLKFRAGPAGDSEINGNVNINTPSRYSDKELALALKAAEMQIEIVQRRNINLERKLQSTILQEHDSFRNERGAYYAAERELISNLIDIGVDKYPFETMTLQEKINALEAQLSYSCQEKAKLKLLVEECEMNHRQRRHASPYSDQNVSKPTNIFKDTIRGRNHKDTLRFKHLNSKYASDGAVRGVSAKESRRLGKGEVRPSLPVKKGESKEKKASHVKISIPVAKTKHSVAGSKTQKFVDERRAKHSIQNDKQKNKRINSRGDKNVYRGKVSDLEDTEEEDTDYYEEELLDEDSVGVASDNRENIDDESDNGNDVDEESNNGSNIDDDSESQHIKRQNNSISQKRQNEIEYRNTAQKSRSGSRRNEKLSEYRNISQGQFDSRKTRDELGHLNNTSQNQPSHSRQFDTDSYNKNNKPTNKSKENQRSQKGESSNNKLNKFFINDNSGHDQIRGGSTTKIATLKPTTNKAFKRNGAFAILDDPGSEHLKTRRSGNQNGKESVRAGVYGRKGSIEQRGIKLKNPKAIGTLRTTKEKLTDDLHEKNGLSKNKKSVNTDFLRTKRPVVLGKSQKGVGVLREDRINSLIHKKNPQKGSPQIRKDIRNIDPQSERNSDDSAEEESVYFDEDAEESSGGFEEGSDYYGIEDEEFQNIPQSRSDRRIEIMSGSNENAKFSDRQKENISRRNRSDQLQEKNSDSKVNVQLNGRKNDPHRSSSRGRELSVDKPDTGFFGPQHVNPREISTKEPQTKREASIRKGDEHKAETDRLNLRADSSKHTDKSGFFGKKDSTKKMESKFKPGNSESQTLQSKEKLKHDQKMKQEESKERKRDHPSLKEKQAAAGSSKSRTRFDDKNKNRPVNTGAKKYIPEISGSKNDPHNKLRQEYPEEESDYAEEDLVEEEYEGKDLDNVNLMEGGSEFQNSSRQIRSKGHKGESSKQRQTVDDYGKRKDDRRSRSGGREISDESSKQRQIIDDSGKRKDDRRSRSRGREISSESSKQRQNVDDSGKRKDDRRSRSRGREISDESSKQRQNVDDSGKRKVDRRSRSRGRDISGERGSTDIRGNGYDNRKSLNKELSKSNPQSKDSNARTSKRTGINDRITDADPGHKDSNARAGKRTGISDIKTGGETADKDSNARASKRTGISDMITDVDPGYNRTRKDRNKTYKEFDPQNVRKDSIEDEETQDAFNEPGAIGKTGKRESKQDNLVSKQRESRFKEARPGSIKQKLPTDESKSQKIFDEKQNILPFQANQYSRTNSKDITSINPIMSDIGKATDESADDSANSVDDSEETAFYDEDEEEATYFDRRKEGPNKTGEPFLEHHQGPRLSGSHSIERRRGSTSSDEENLSVFERKIPSSTSRPTAQGHGQSMLRDPYDMAAENPGGLFQTRGASNTDRQNISEREEVYKSSVQGTTDALGKRNGEEGRDRGQFVHWDSQATDTKDPIDGSRSIFGLSRDDARSRGMSSRRPDGRSRAGDSKNPWETLRKNLDERSATDSGRREGQGRDILNTADAALRGGLSRNADTRGTPGSLFRGDQNRNSDRNTLDSVLRSGQSRESDRGNLDFVGRDTQSRDLDNRNTGGSTRRLERDLELIKMENDRLKAQVYRKEEDLDRLTSDHQMLERRTQSLQAEINAKREALPMVAQSTIRRMEEERSRLEEFIRQNQLKQAESDRRAARTEESITSELRSVQTQLREIERMHEGCKLEKKQFANTKLNLENEMRNLRRELKEAQSDGQQWRMDAQKAKLSVEQMEKLLGEVQKRASGASGYLPQKETFELSQQIRQYASREKDLEREIGELRASLKSIDRDKDEMRVELDHKDEKLASMIHDCSLHMDEIARLQLQLKNLDLQLGHSDSTTRDHEREMQAARRQIDSLRQDLEKAMKERDEAQKDLRRVSGSKAKGDAEKRSIETDLDRANKETAELRKQLQKYIDEVRRIEDMLLQKDEELNSLLEHYRTLTIENSNLENHRTSLEKEINTNLEGVREAMDQNYNLKSQITTQASLLKSYEEEIERLTQTVASLENSLSKSTDGEKALQADIKAARDLIHRLETTMDKYKLETAHMESSKNQLEAESRDLQAYIESLNMELNRERSSQQELEQLLSSTREDDYKGKNRERELTIERNQLVERINLQQTRTEAMIEELSRYRLKATELQTELERVKRQYQIEKSEKDNALSDLKRLQENLNSSSVSNLIANALGSSISPSQFGSSASARGNLRTSDLSPRDAAAPQTTAQISPGQASYTIESRTDPLYSPRSDSDLDIAPVDASTSRLPPESDDDRENI